MSVATLPPVGLVAFAGARLDRADHVRADADRLAALRTPAARLLLLDGLDPVIAADGALAWGRDRKSVV